jgi:hypothetical protein
VFVQSDERRKLVSYATAGHSQKTRAVFPRKAETDSPEQLSTHFCGTIRLRSFDLDNSAIVVEAYRSSIAHLTAIDRRLMELALRSDKIFRQIEDR